MAISKLIEVIEGQKTWTGYQRSLDIARDAKEVFAEDSEGQRRVIEGIRASESKDALAMRLRVSNPVTGAALSGPLSYQAKIARAPDRHERFSYPPDAGLATRAEAAFERFFDGDTLYGYLFTQSCIANNFDPGRWLVFEVAETEAGTLRPYPVEVGSEEAIWVEYDRFGELEYLIFVRMETAMPAPGRDVEYRHWWVYGRETAAEGIEVKQGVEVPGGWHVESIMEGTTRLSFAWMEYEINLPFVPAVQLGAYRDNIRPECNALFYQAAVPMLRDMMHKGTTLHGMEIAQGFPKRFSYVKACTGQNEQGMVCTGGYYGGIHEKDMMCKSCHGAGRVKQASELEEVELLWPEGMETDAIIDLTRLVYDHRPPIDTLNYFNDKLNAYFRLIGALIFNQDLTEGVSMKTATEINAAEQSITNHLRLMAEKIENAWEFAHLCYIAYSGGNPDNCDVSLSHPEDMQVSPLSAVLADLSLARQAGASIGAIDALEKRILHRLYKNEAVRVSDAVAFSQHLPWRDKSPAEAAAISQSRQWDDPDRIVYENFSRIQAEVSAALNGLPFSKLNWQAQKERIARAVELIVSQAKPVEAPEPAGIEEFNFEPGDPGENGMN